MSWITLKFIEVFNVGFHVDLLGSGHWKWVIEKQGNYRNFIVVRNKEKNTVPTLHYSRK